jgi:hypothetical protein
MEGYQTCGVRVWWYQNANHTGYNHCLNPEHGWFPSLTYKSIDITGTSRACPAGS